MVIWNERPSWGSLSEIGGMLHEFRFEVVGDACALTVGWGEDVGGTVVPCVSGFGVGIGFGDFFGGNGLEFFADGVGGEAGGEEAAIEAGDFVVGNFAAR